MRDTTGMDEYTWTQPSPFGELIIRAGAKGVRSIEFHGGRSAKRGPASVASLPAQCREISRAFARYFDGDARALLGIPVDLSAVRSDFRRTVLTTLRNLIGPGQTTTYGKLAAAAGRPGTARAVGSAMAQNPVPIIVPCHRVLASDGTLGGYGGGLEMKRALLRIEGANVRARRRRPCG